ncbi:hypothetical protein NHX12_020278 [Muraenolepis orangiensis]|uniref:Solute carrier family 41 member n=1 Tax=Muraenolepis orangiensis TaxID=630683 RepID=A0A9Q0ER61_9TELE|nr:hypothetical protein NHX12_020278 [Muraenolepis orangiensis]
MSRGNRESGAVGRRSTRRPDDLIGFGKFPERKSAGTSMVSSLSCLLEWNYRPPPPADWMVHSMWRSGKDPDSFSIPYLTALGDLLGTALLALSFHFLWIIGDRDSDVGD